MPDIKALGDQFIAVVRDYVSRSVGAIADQVAALDRRITELPTPKDGKDADPEVIKAAIEAAVAAIPRPHDGLDGKDGRDGIDGKDADPAVIKSAVEEAVAAIPRPDDGAAGKDGRDGIDGKSIDIDVVRATIADLVAAIPRPADGAAGKDGKDADPEFIREAVAKAVDAIPKPKDGESIHPDTVALMIRDAVDKAVAAIPKARDGQDGRDAAALDILPAIEPSKSYPRGTFAEWEGGVIRALRNTDPLKEGDRIDAAGWHVVMRGVSFMQVEGSEDKRTVTVRTAFTGSPVVETELHFPVTIYRGIYQADTSYEEGDAVTWDGSIWNALKSTQEKPGASDAWRLSVKRGRDGRDGVRGEKGERGAEGRAGKDLTQKGPDGSKW